MDIKHRLKTSWPFRIVFAIGVIFAIGLWYVSIPALIIWAIYKKSKAPKALKHFASVCIALLFLVITIGVWSSKPATTESGGQAQVASNQQESKPAQAAHQSFVESELTEDSVRAEINKLDGIRSMSGNEITSVELIDNGGTEDIIDDKIVAITYKPKSVWDEADTVKKTADTTVAASEKLFKHPKVGMVRVITTGDFTDQYGQSETGNAVRMGLQRSTAEKLNWDTFKDMVFLDYNKLLDIADEQWMHAAIRKAL
jgi:hypothetical protein